MTVLLAGLIGAIVGSGLTYAFRGAIQHEKQAVAQAVQTDAKNVVSAVEKKL